MKSTYPRFLSITFVVLGTLALAPVSMAAIIIEHLTLDTGGTDYALPTLYPSSTDYADASQGHATVSVTNGGNAAKLNNGVWQNNGFDTTNSLWNFYDFIIDLGSVQTVGAVNTFTWCDGRDEARQDQGYTLYVSSAATRPTVVPDTGAQDSGWTAVGTVQTTYATDTLLGGQVGVSITDVGSARWLLVDVAESVGRNNDGFFGEVDVFVVPEPTSALLGGLGLLALMRRQRA